VTDVIIPAISCGVYSCCKTWQKKKTEQ